MALTGGPAAEARATFTTHNAPNFFDLQSAPPSSKKERILKAFEENVFPNVNILPFDQESGRVFGTLKAELEKRGIGCSEPDLRIAAVTLQHNLTLVTGNTKHFKNIPGLSIENWIS